VYRSIFRLLATLLASLWLFGTAPAWSQTLDLNTEVSINIPAQLLDAALLELSHQASFQLVISTGSLPVQQVPAITGKMPIRVALDRLLHGTDLSYKWVGEHTVTVTRGGNGASSGGEGLPAQPSTRATDTRSNLEEVVVTAQKKSERLLDVPVPLTVVDTEALANSGAGRLQDYYAAVPGLSLQGSPGGGGTQYITIRGISTTNGSGPTVAMMIDDVPFGLSTGTDLGQWGYPDIDPSDLARIEILKGPQGTLYGADSLSGLINIVTKDPSTAAFSGHLQVLGEDILDGPVGYGVRGSVNVPVSEDFAVRASGYYRNDPGYVDNVRTGQDNVNSANVYGGRVSTLWQATDGISLKLGAMLQNTQGFGTSWVNTNSLFQPSIGDLRQTGLAGTGGYNNQVQLYTAKLTAKFGTMTLVSLSGYGVDKWANLEDASSVSFYYLPNFPAQTAAAGPQSSTTDKYSQEFRLNDSVGSWLDWLAGAFYTHEHCELIQNTTANNATGALLDYTSYGTELVSFHEYAIFGDLTVHFTDHFDVQVGGRDSWDKQTFNVGATGALYTPPEYFAEHASGTATTYLLTPEYKISPDAMVYARIASGYRIGGPNFPPPAGVTYPIDYAPDKTTNYDIGMKASVLDKKLTFDVSAYYINWRDIQVGTTGGGGCCYFEVNGGAAKSEGIEASVQAQPIQGTTISFQGSVGTAELTQALPTAGYAYGPPGDRLPYSIPKSGSLSIDQDLFHIADTTGFLGASIMYVGERKGEFQGSDAPRLLYPAYTTVNLHAGIRHDQWHLNLFANNVGNRRGIIGGGNSTSIDNPAGYYATVIQPRTVGLSISRDF